MTDPPKKFSLSFSKVVKKTNLLAPPPIKNEKTNNVQFIDCLDSKAIKLKDGSQEDKDEAPLVIPIIGPRRSSTLVNGKSIAEIVEDFSDVSKQDVPKQEVLGNIGPLDALEAVAAREILQESTDSLKEVAPSTLESLPVADDSDKKKREKESTLEDYESIPVNQFGLAMLRGMGWKPDEGIGKNKKLVPVTAPVVRPKGMGLGADKVVHGTSAPKTSSSKDEELKMVKGAHVKIVNKNQYAQVEGFSDDSGRAIVKMAIGGHVLSVNEASLQLVSKSEYSKNSKVLNASKFDAFKQKEEREKSPSRRNKSPSLEVKPKYQSPSSSRSSKKTNSNCDQSNRYMSPKRKQSQSPDLKHRKRSSSISPGRVDRKETSTRSHRDRSQSPHISRHRKVNPTSMSERYKSSSPDRKKRHYSPSSRRRRSRSCSQSKEHYSQSKKCSDSNSDSKSSKKKKKKHKERRQHSSSSSKDRSRSRSHTPRKKRKEKKSKRSRSRSPTSRRHR